MVIAWSNIEREDPSKSRGKTQNIGDTEWRWLNELLPGKKARSTCRRDIFFCCDTRERLKLYTPVIIGSYIYFKTTHTGWQLARVVGIAEDGESKSLPHSIKMLDLVKQYNQRPPFSEGADNCELGARSVVLACTPVDSERQELHTITGIDRTQGGGR